MEHHIVGLEELHVPYPTFSVALTSHHYTSQAELQERVKDATIIIATTVKLNADTLSAEKTPRLQMIAVMAAGTDLVDFEACKKRGIVVSNCPHASSEVVGDHAIGLYFAARRKTVMLHTKTTAVPSEWKAKGSVASYLKDSAGNAPLSAADEVCGIIGYGALGKRIETTAKALGMEVLIADRKNGSSLDSTTSRTPFAEVLKRSTLLILCLPRTPESLSLISTSELKAMSPQTVIVNVSRGGIVDEKAILDALKDGTISGYATDVLVTEPAEGPEDSPLLSEDTQSLNLTISPHVAWNGERTRRNLQRILKDNIESFIAGSPKNVII